MDLQGLNIGIGICGSFCTINAVINEIKALCELGINIYTVFSFNSQSIDTRFGKAKDIIADLKIITGHEPILTIEDAEPIGPKKLFDVFLIAPCTGNTIAKLNSGITDTPVLMAAKAHLRNNRPLALAIATNDALGVNLENIGSLINKKNIYFVPFGQDDCIKKPKSMLAHFEKIKETLENCLDGEQIQPVIS